jgi:hypothetical protein
MIENGENMRKQCFLRYGLLLIIIGGFTLLNSCQKTESSSPTEPAALSAKTWSARVVFRGHIWYYGNSRLSCNEVCEPHGGCDDAGMSLIGSGEASEQMCRRVLDELKVPVNEYATGEARYLPHAVNVYKQPAQWQVGCAYASSYVDGGIRLLYYPSTNAANGPDGPEFASLYRVCACQQ